jgi:hypothetical protein
MPLEVCLTTVRVEAPDEQSALALQRGLARLRPLAVGARGIWAVELRDTEGHVVEEVEMAVRLWLRDRDLPSTVMSADGSAWRVGCDPEP